jgi:hypothetical protein
MARDSGSNEKIKQLRLIAIAAMIEGKIFATSSEAGLR